MTTKKRNPQDNTKAVQGRRDRGQDERVKILEKQVKALEEWKKEVERRLYNLEPMGAKESWKDDL